MLKKAYKVTAQFLALGKNTRLVILDIDAKYKKMIKD